MRLVISVREISIRLMNFMYATSRLTERADFPEHTENDAILGAEWRPDRARRYKKRLLRGGRIGLISKVVAPDKFFRKNFKDGLKNGPPMVYCEKF